MKDLIKKIKQKKELSDIPDKLVEETLHKYLKKYNLKLTLSPKSQKIIIKQIRADLRKYTGRYQISNKKRKNLIQENNVKELLKTHTSTKERISYYPILIRKLKKLNPKSILDLGCGLNPIAIATKFPNSKYHAIDIKKDELNLIYQFFKKNNIIGTTQTEDIRKINEFPKADVTLIFKTLDIIETKGHKNSANIVKKIKSPVLIVSFSTRTLSGKPMNFPRRQWFENLLKALHYKYKIENSNNEVFYFIRK